MKTRKLRKTGGSLLGEGITGKTVNVGCISGGNSFCKEIEGKVDLVKEIIIYDSEKGSIFLKEKKDILQFVDFVHSLHKKIAKVIKDPPPFIKKSKQEIFFDELQSNRKIIDIYGTQSDMFLTIAPIKYKDLQILGAQVILSNASPIYVVFGQKCKNRFQILSSHKLKVWLNHILNSLIILQKKEFMHNDIKPDNTVLCDNTFTLIDWGFACPMNYKDFKKSDGDDMFISPIRWYITGTSKNESFNKLIEKTKRKNKRLYTSSIWRTFFSYIEEEVNYALSLHLSHEQLFERYKYALDVMMIGITIVEVVHNSNLSWRFWKPVVEKLVSHREPMTAEKALQYVKQI